MKTRKRAPRAKSVAAFAWSISIHAAVLYAASRAAWSPDEREPSPPPVAVIWIDDASLASLRALPDEVERSDAGPEVQTEPEEPTPAAPELVELSESRETPPRRAPQTEIDVTEPVESETLAEPTEPTEPTEPVDPPDPADRVERGREPDRPTEADRSAPARNYIVRDVDWNEELSRAVEQMREQQLREESYTTFSLDDVREPPVPEEPGPTESIFERAARQSSPPSILSPGRARTAFGQRLAQLCNSLTGGGIGLMGFASLCADPDEPPGLFAHLKPSYLRSRPVCTEVTTAAGVVSDEEIKAMKCRLVVQDE